MDTIEIYPGDYEPIELTFTDEESGEPIPLTGMTVKLLIYSDPDDTEPLIEKTVTEHTDPDNGISEVILTETDTAKFSKNKYYHAKPQLLDGEGHPSTATGFKIKGWY